MKYIPFFAAQVTILSVACLSFQATAETPTPLSSAAQKAEQISSRKAASERSALLDSRNYPVYRLVAIKPEQTPTRIKEYKIPPPSGENPLSEMSQVALEPQLALEPKVRSAAQKTMVRHRVAVNATLPVEEEATRTTKPPASKPPASDAGQSLLVTSAKTLKIMFLGYKELTGIYAVNADATISIPVLGRVSVKKIDAAKLERILSKKVTLVTGRKGYATVEVIAYQPVFVTGGVKASKSFSWTPGMTVLHAITLAGGTSLLSQGGVNIPLSANSERSRLQQAVDKLKRSVAQLARLRAERAGEQSLSIPRELLDLVGKAEADGLIAAQTDVLKTNNTAHNNQYKAIQQAIKTAKKELGSMEARKKMIRRQTSLRQKHRRRLQKLQKRGLVGNTAIIDMETKIAETEEKGLALMVARANLQGRLLDLERAQLQVNQKKEGNIDKKILRLEREIAGYEIDMRTARKALRALYGGGLVPVMGTKAKPTEYSIVRESGNGVRTVKVDKFTRVRPGDIIVVNK